MDSLSPAASIPAATPARSAAVMPAAPVFGPVPDFLWDKTSRPAREELHQLHKHVRYHRREDLEYGAGSWGYTVLRTVYTPESDALFPTATTRGGSRGEATVPVGWSGPRSVGVATGDC